MHGPELIGRSTPLPLLAHTPIFFWQADDLHRIDSLIDSKLHCIEDPLPIVHID